MQMQTMAAFFGVLAGLNGTMLAVLIAVRAFHYNVLTKDYPLDVVKALENRWLFKGTLILAPIGAALNAYFCVGALKNATAPWHVGVAAVATVATAMCFISFALKGAMMGGSRGTYKRVVERLAPVGNIDGIDLLLQFAQRRYESRDLAAWETALDALASTAASLLCPSAGRVEGSGLSLRGHAGAAAQNEYRIQSFVERLIDLSSGSSPAFTSCLVPFLATIVRNAVNTGAHAVALHATTQLVEITFRNKAGESGSAEQGSIQPHGLLQIAELSEWTLSVGNPEVTRLILELLFRIVPERVQGEEHGSRLIFRRLLPLCSLLWQAAIASKNDELSSQTLLLLRRIGQEVPGPDRAGLIVSRLEELGITAAESASGSGVVFVRKVLRELALMMGEAGSDRSSGLANGPLVRRAIAASYARILASIAPERKKELLLQLAQSDESLVVDTGAGGA